jgi:hypothetical protein
MPYSLLRMPVIKAACPYHPTREMAHFLQWLQCAWVTAPYSSQQPLCIIKTPAAHVEWYKVPQRAYMSRLVQQLSSTAIKRDALAELNYIKRWVSQTSSEKRLGRLLM